MLDSYNGLFAADFQVPTLVQVFFVIQCLWTGVMGVLCTYDPAWSPITENGVFTREGSKEKVVHPNVRGAWNVRGGSMFLVAAGALYFGTRETYLVTMAAAIWREGYDETYQRMYYFNMETGDSLWHKPDAPYKPYAEDGASTTSSGSGRTSSIGE